MFPSLVAFDLDETLTESKQPLTPGMAGLLAELLARVPVAVVSGGKFDIFRAHVYERLPAHARFHNLYAVPTCGAALYQFSEADFVPVYRELISEEEARIICAAIEQAINETGVIDMGEPSYGERIEHRGSQVTLSALGQVAPLDLKKAWDPDRVKRPVLRDAIARLLPEFDVKTGGATSFDVTRPGINKAYGLRKLATHLALPIDEMVYIGDALFPGGNDEVVKETGVRTIATSGPEETARIIRDLLGT